MIVLGISETHCATAAILRDGAVVACASEERFTRLKNDAGYPGRAIDALLREHGTLEALYAHLGSVGRPALRQRFFLCFGRRFNDRRSHSRKPGVSLVTQALQPFEPIFSGRVSGQKS